MQQNVNVLNGGVSTGQREQRQHGSGGPAGERAAVGPRLPGAYKGDGGPARPPAQQNDSDQGQVQVVPIAPQLNVQNVNALTAAS